MSLGNKFLRLYFDLVYNPIYDLSSARLTAYRRWQKNCVGKLHFEDGESVLCVGIGTGNEIPYILDSNKDIEIVGVDFSKSALKRAHNKGLKQNKEIEISQMDARELQYPTGSFDKVLCLHVMDFVEDDVKVTREILRVLKLGGQFVITYPSQKESIALGFNLVRDSIHHSHNLSGYLRVMQDLLVQMALGILYLPVLLRLKKRAYSYQAMKAMFSGIGQTTFQIDEDPAYNDFIVSGKKELILFK